MTSASRPGREDMENLSGAQDPMTVKRAAVAFARSPALEDHQLLGRFLSEEAALMRLDSPEMYQQTYQDLRLTAVIHALTENPAPSAQQLLVWLTSVDLFLADLLRRQLLVRALSVVRPSPSRVVAFWDRQSQPGSLIDYDVMLALCMNQSSLAIKLLAQKLGDSGFDLLQRVDWIHLLFLPRRNDLPILRYSDWLVSQTAESALQVAVVETLFDYRPDDWYVGNRPPVPPSAVTADEECRRLLRQIGLQALMRLDLSVSLGQTIRAGIAELDDRR